MTAEAILDELLSEGIEPCLTADGTGIEVPAGVLTDAQRAAIRQNKAELIACIQEAARVTAELLAAASNACDAWGDDAKAREDMRQQCMETPWRLRAELTQHFRRAYGEGQQ